MVNMLKVLIAVVLLLGFTGIGMLGKKLKSFFVFKTSKTPQKESVWLEIVAGILVVFIATAYYIRKDPSATWYMWIGVVVFFLGGFMQLVAKKQLRGQTFEERVNTGFDNAIGLYKRIRHPSKTALLLLLGGYCLALGSGWALIILLVLFVPSLLFRISQEERALREEFGESWEHYKSETKRLIPSVF